MNNPISRARVSQASARFADPMRAEGRPPIPTAPRVLTLDQARALGTQIGREIQSQYEAAARVARPKAKPAPTKQNPPPARRQAAPTRREAAAAGAARERRIAQRSRQIDRLSTIENIYMDRAEEIQYVSDLPEAQYQAHLSRMRKSYRRSGPSAADALAAGKALAPALLVEIDAVPFHAKDINAFVRYIADRGLLGRDPMQVARSFKAARLVGSV